LFPKFHWRAGTNQRPITKRVVDPVYWRPIFVFLVIAIGVASLFAAIGARPVIFHNVIGGMGCIDQGIIAFWPCAISDELDFGGNRNHGVTKPVNFSKRFRLGWLDHQGASNRK
jgi:hypothetical protein